MKRLHLNNYYNELLTTLITTNNTTKRKEVAANLLLGRYCQDARGRARAGTDTLEIYLTAIRYNNTAATLSYDMDYYLDIERGKVYYSTPRNITITTLDTDTIAEDWHDIADSITINQI